MTRNGTMTLEEYHKKYGIKRIDFSRVHETKLETQYASDSLICPYCKGTVEYEFDDVDSILKGTPYQCPHCDKWFFAEGEASIDTWCKPMEDAVIALRPYIEDTYNHIDKCIELGLKFDEKEGRGGCVEWEAYARYARPLFENEEMEVINNVSADV